MDSAAESAPDVVARFECSRCHDAPGKLPKEPLERDCVGCHQAVFTDAFAEDYTADGVAGWRGRIHSLRVTPSLVGTERLRADWLRDFLSTPHDVRPGLAATMPRLPMTDAERDAVVDWLGGAPPEREAQPEGDVSAGIDTMQIRGCGACHAFSGVWDGPTMNDFSAPIALAPDLAHTRHRMTTSGLHQWLRDPASMKPDTRMPTPALSETERVDVVAALMFAPLPETAPPDVPALLPPLERPVGWAEVDAAVFRPICRHCHATPSEENRGDAGPGNTGGFGYPGAGLDLSSREGVLRGAQRRPRSPSVIIGEPPPLVATLMRRYHEEAGEWSDAPGMPLGLPPLPPEKIQLVTTWLAQGAPP